MAQATFKESKDLLGPWDEEVGGEETVHLVEEKEKGEVDELRRKIDMLQDSMDQLVRILQKGQGLERKPLLKPRDIPILELEHLQGVEGEGRLEVFFSQI